MLSCSDFPDVRCCQSCHEDIEYGFPLIELEDDMGSVVGHVCCGVWNEVFSFREEPCLTKMITRLAAEKKELLKSLEGER